MGHHLQIYDLLFISSKIETESSGSSLIFNSQSRSLLSEDSFFSSHPKQPLVGFITLNSHSLSRVFSLSSEHINTSLTFLTKSRPADTHEDSSH